MNDLRFAIRQLAKSPGFTTVAALTLALGIGANTAIFSVINGVLLKPLPYPHSERLVMLWERNPQRGIEQQKVSHPNFVDWKEQNRVFESMSFWCHAFYWKDDAAINLVGSDAVEKARCAYAASGVFTALQAKPLFGRTFLPEEDQLQGPRVAILSYDLWQRRFGGNTNVLGQSLTVDSYNRRTYTVVGVMPPGFRFPDRCEFWLPAGWSGMLIFPEMVDAPSRASGREARRLNVLARLKPGMSIEQAQAEMNTIQARLKEQYREVPMGSEVVVAPLLDQMLGPNVKLALLVLWGVVAGVLLIACVNVANLLLARAANRQKEIALRFVLGASRWRVIRQLLTESLLLAVLGGGLGVWLGNWGLQLFIAASPGYIPRLQESSLDGSALLFTVLLSLGTGFVFGLAPAWQFTRRDLNNTLKEDNRAASASRSSARIRNSLVVAEVALSLVLLIGAGLMLQSFVRLVRTDRGIKPEHVLTAELDFSVTGFTTWTQTTDTRPQVRLQELLERLRNQPGVQAVGATSWLPRRTDGPPNQPIVIIGRPPEAAGDGPIADHAGVSPGYFRALGIPLLRGRDFTEADQLETQPVFIINETLAKRYFPTEDPLGKMLAFPSRTNRWAPGEYYQNRFPVIVGVVADVTTLSLKPQAHPFYSPYWQYPMQNPIVTVRVAGDPTAFATALRGEIKAVLPGLPTPVIQTMDNLLAEVVAQPRFQAWMLSVFGTVALVLAALGLYGVLAYAVTQRTHEIGIRMALGAQKWNVLSLVIRHGMKLAVMGLGIGVLVALGLARVLRTLLYEVTPTDPLTFVAVSFLLVVIALFSCWLPARRATRVDPMEALRCE